MSRTKKKVLLIVFGSVGAYILTVLFIVFFALMMSSHVDYGSYYNEFVEHKDKVEYFSGTIDEIHLDEKNHKAWISFSWVDVNDYLERYKDTPNYFGNDRNNVFRMPYYENKFDIYGKTFDALMEQGFFDAVDKDTVVTIYTYNRSFDDGYPVVGVSTGDTEYVDFETGFQNWLAMLKQWRDGKKRQSPIKVYNPEN